MRATVMLAAAALMTAVAVDVPAAGQRFRSGVDAVAVDVLVTRDRRTVVGLSAENFVVYDSGVPQWIDGVFFQTLPLNKVFLRILDEFRSRYVLTCSPQGVPASGWHPIEVRLKGARGDIRARRGYLRQ